MQMLPRGTKTRTAKQIAEFFDSIGGELDAACGNNSWSWSATCLKDDFDKAFEVYADVVNNPTFPDDELATMKQRVLAEIASLDADWTTQAFRFFKQKFYGPANSPYRFMTIGQAENVNALTAGQLREWYEKKVIVSKRVLAIYGDVEPAHAEELSKMLLAGAKQSVQDTRLVSGPGGVDHEFFTRGETVQPSIEIRRVETQKTEQALAGVVIGFESKSVIGDESNYRLAVADTMASGYGYPTGYLHEILRGRGLVYVVHAVNQPGLDAKLPGTFLIYAGCDPAHVNEVVDTILENIARLQSTPKDLNEDWFKRSKDLIVVSDAMDNQTPAEQAATAALDELYGLGYTYHDKFADKIKAVDLPGVTGVSRARLTSCVVTVSTPAPQGVNVKPGTRTYASFPEVDLTPKGVTHDAGGAN
jgi:zinc protease